MAYILDDKKNVEAYIVSSGTQPIITSLEDTQIQALFSIGPNDTGKYTFPASKAPGMGYILEDTKGNGLLEWVLPSGGGSSGDQSINFKRIVDGGFNYMLGTTDYGIEIVSDTYSFVTLPLAAGSGGRVFFVSRASDNNALKIVTQGSDTIDGYPDSKFLRKYTHMTLMSNDVDKWYIV
jgi:hypothetical protein